MCLLDVEVLVGVFVCLYVLGCFFLKIINSSLAAQNQSLIV